MKIVILNTDFISKGDLDWSLFEKYENIVFKKGLTRKTELESAQDAEIVLCEKTRIDREFLDHAPHLKLVVVMSTGYNQVDLKACTERKITVCNIPSYGTSIVAQYTMALLLEACHRIGSHVDYVKRGGWSRFPNPLPWFTEQIALENKTFGIIGYGRIGNRVGEMAKAFGMHLLTANGDISDLNQVLENSDVISLHCNLTEENRNLINETTIEKMKSGVILINTARGGLVDETALYEALKTKKIAAAAMDVSKKEPIDPKNPLLRLDNYILTPHMAWGAKQPRQKILELSVETVDRYLEGQPIHVVNEI